MTLDKSRPSRTGMTRCAVVASAALFVGGADSPTGAEPAKAFLSTMAPIKQYLSSDPADEIAQARTAAPASISIDAEVMTLGPLGYETAVKGKNGFVCLVQRAWFSSLGAPDFWSPAMHAPICYNQQAARSVLPVFLERTRWAMAGMPEAAMIEHTKAAILAGQFPAPEIGTLTYMMAKSAYLGGGARGPWHPHLMFFLPRMKAADWGANLPASPVMATDGVIEPFTTFYVPVANWSDGTSDLMQPPM